MAEAVQAQESPVAGLEEDPEGSRIVAEEMRLLGVVVRGLAAATTSAASHAEARERDEAHMLELRELAAVAKPEDLPALFDQMHTLNAVRAQRGRGVSGSVDPKTPYFGHLRVEEGGKRRDVLIGARSYLDTRAGIRIVDWRHAPVSKIFYRYAEGDNYEEELGDRFVEGDVVVRRTVSIVDGALVRVSAPQGTFVKGKDGVWSRQQARTARLRTDKKPTLGGAAQREDRLLPAIASLLDAAQYELVTRPGAGLLTIQGSAGSGKTTVGLHRAAFLAFHDPARFRADKMLVIVPHEALKHFVGHVLPSLGVEGVRVDTFAAWSKPIVSTLFPKLPSIISENTPPVVSRAKSHPAMLRAIEHARDRVIRMMDQRVLVAMGKWPEGEQISRAWAESADKVIPDVRVTALSHWVKNADLPAVTRSAVENLGHELRHLARAVVGTWDEILTHRPALDEVFAGVPGFGPGQLDQVHDWCVRQARVRQEGERDGDPAALDAEDPALLMRIWQTLRGPLLDGGGKPLRYVHLFVDEVQDASPVELRVLLDLTGKERSVTLAGDTAQRMLDDDVDHRAFDWNELLTDLGIEHQKLAPLQVSYRSTAEITKFARGVLGPHAHEAEPIATRSGPPVELFPFSSVGEAVAFLADVLKNLAFDEPHAQVALLSRFAPQADAYFDGLSRAEVPNVRRVAELDFTWEPGFDVTDIRQTKGLEFDEVIVIDANASTFPDAPAARHALYVGATRASHQLWCVSSDTPSPIVTAALAAS